MGKVQTVIGVEISNREGKNQHTALVLSQRAPPRGPLAENQSLGPGAWGYIRETLDFYAMKDGKPVSTAIELGQYITLTVIMNANGNASWLVVHSNTTINNQKEQ